MSPSHQLVEEPASEVDLCGVTGRVLAASGLVSDRYIALGGPVERVVKPGRDHHPYDLMGVAQVVTFFTSAPKQQS